MLRVYQVNMISSPTKGDIDHERRLVVAQLINHSIRNIENKHQRCFEGSAINKRFGKLLKPYINCRGVSWSNGTFSSDESTFEFGAAQMQFSLTTNYKAEHFYARWIDFMYIHHIPFTNLKDVYIIADNRVFSYRACKIDITDYD